MSPHSLCVFPPVNTRFIIALPIPISPTPPPSPLLPFFSVMSPSLFSCTPDPSRPSIPPESRSRGSQAPRSVRSDICVTIRGVSLVGSKIFCRPLIHRRLHQNRFLTPSPYPLSPTMTFPGSPSPTSSLYPVENLITILTFYHLPLSSSSSSSSSSSFVNWYEVGEGGGADSSTLSHVKSHPSPI